MWESQCGHFSFFTIFLDLFIRYWTGIYPCSTKTFDLGFLYLLCGLVLREREIMHNLMTSLVTLTLKIQCQIIIFRTIFFPSKCYAMNWCKGSVHLRPGENSENSKINVLFIVWYQFILQCFNSYIINFTMFKIEYLSRYNLSFIVRVWCLHWNFIQIKHRPIGQQSELLKYMSAVMLHICFSILLSILYFTFG